jgi:spermidine/putrescine transport system permease protein
VSGTQAPSSSRVRELALRGLSFLPLAVVLLLIGAPMFWIFRLSLMERGTYGGWVEVWSLASYVRILDALYLDVFFRSLALATFTAVTSVVLGVPLAFWIARARARIQKFLVLTVLIAFWTNGLVRIFAIRSLGIEPGWSLVVLGMLSAYLPLVVFPVAAGLMQVDPQWSEAARNLGASRLRAFFEVGLRSIFPSILTGFSLVFVPTLGEFVIPDLLGGAKTVLLGNLLSEQYLKARDWPFGSALLITIIGWVFISRALGKIFRSGRSETSSATRRIAKPVPGIAVSSSLPAWLLIVGPMVLVLAQAGQVVLSGRMTLAWSGIFSRPEILDSIQRSLILALISSFLSVTLGFWILFAEQGSQARIWRWTRRMAEIPLLVPELVVGVGIVALWSLLRFELGWSSLIASHVSLTLAWVLLVLRPRVTRSALQIQEAAQDLGAGLRLRLTRVVLPVMAGALFGAFAIAFSISFDDFQSSFFSAGVGQETLPLHLYSMIRYGAVSSVQVIASLLILFTATVVGVAFSWWNRSRSRS